MMLIIPDEISGKITWIDGKPVALEDLSPEEQKIFDKFCIEDEKCNQDRFGMD